MSFGRAKYMISNSIRKYFRILRYEGYSVFSAPVFSSWGRLNPIRVIKLRSNDEPPNSFLLMKTSPSIKLPLIASYALSLKSLFFKNKKQFKLISQKKLNGCYWFFLSGFEILACDFYFVSSKTTKNGQIFQITRGEWRYFLSLFQDGCINFDQKLPERFLFHCSIFWANQFPLSCSRLFTSYPSHHNKKHRL